MFLCVRQSTYFFLDFSILTYTPVAPIYIRFLDRSISASQSVSRDSEGHVESVRPIKCMLFILICNNICHRH
jgi:hypothetical protein